MIVDGTSQPRPLTRAALFGLLAAGCFAEPQVLKADPQTSTSSASATTSDSTAIAPPGTDDSRDTPDPVTTTSSRGESEADTVVWAGSSDEADSSSTGADPVACQPEFSGCRPKDVFCEDFEDFAWDGPGLPWSEVPGGSGLWFESAEPSYCGTAALRTEVDVGHYHSILGATLPALFEPAMPHTVRVAMRLTSGCTADDTTVRALVLQYLDGGTQTHAVELWIGAQGYAIHQPGIDPSEQAMKIASDRWFEVLVSINPGRTVVTSVDGAAPNISPAPSASALGGLRAQLLVGPSRGTSTFATGCAELFDDVAVSNAN